jgi:hypothetical protein
VRVSIGYTAFMTNVSFPSVQIDWGMLAPYWSYLGKRRYNIKLWKTFTDCFNCLPIAAIIDEKIFTMHGGLSPDLQSMEQIRRVMRPTDVPDTGAHHSVPFRLHISRPSQAFYAISSGPTQTRISPGGQRMTVVYPLLLAPTLCRDSCKNTIWT